MSFKDLVIIMLMNIAYIIITVITGLIIPAIVIFIVACSDVATYKEIFSSVMTWMFIFICVMFAFFHNQSIQK